MSANGQPVSLIPSEEETKGWDSSALVNAGLCILEDEEGAATRVPGHIQRQLSVRITKTIYPFENAR